MRSRNLTQFYELLADLERRTGGKRVLSECTGRMKWPRCGIYFFFELGETRSDTGSEPRVVRVGTHGLKSGSKTKLWTRLSQHRGAVRTGGGNHRGSIFRLIVGTALAEKYAETSVSSWGVGNSASREIRLQEHDHEKRVSGVIRAMPFLWLEIGDEPGPQSLRGVIERNAIALLSNYNKPCLYPPSLAWLGTFCDRERVRRSGLWNQNHVDEQYDPDFLDGLERLISQMKPYR